MIQCDRALFLGHGNQQLRSWQRNRCKANKHKSNTREKVTDTICLENRAMDHQHLYDCSAGHQRVLERGERKIKWTLAIRI